MNKRVILFFMMLISFRSFSQDITLFKDSVWTFELSIIEYPFKEKEGCIPVIKTTISTAKCRVISTDCPLGISVLFVDYFSLYERAIKPEKSITLKGRIKHLEKMTPTCFGSNPVVLRTYLIPEPSKQD